LITEKKCSFGIEPPMTFSKPAGSSDTTHSKTKIKSIYLMNFTAHLYFVPRQSSENPWNNIILGTYTHTYYITFTSHQPSLYLLYFNYFNGLSQIYRTVTIIIIIMKIEGKKECRMDSSIIFYEICLFFKLD